MNAAVHCVIKAFIPLGDIGEAYENVATKLLTSSRNSSFISDNKKTLIIDDIAKICAQFPSSNVHRRAFLAVLAKHLSFDQLQGLKNKFLIYDDDTVDAELPCIPDALARPMLTKRQISSGRKEYYVLKGGQSLKKSVDSREKKSSRAAEGVVSFLLKKDNIAFLSWGNKKVSIKSADGLSNEEFLIPALNRTKHLSQLYAEYDIIPSETDHKFRVGRTSFFAFAGQLTAKEIRRRSAVFEFTNQHGFHNFYFLEE